MQSENFNFHLTPAMRDVLEALKEGQLFIGNACSALFVKAALVHHQTEGALLRRGFMEKQRIEVYILTEEGEKALLEEA